MVRSSGPTPSPHDVQARSSWRAALGTIPDVNAPPVQHVTVATSPVLTEIEPDVSNPPGRSGLRRFRVGSARVLHQIDLVPESVRAAWGRLGGCPLTTAPLAG